LAGIRQRPKWLWVEPDHIRHVVTTSDKQRFELKGDLIRARYGHSRAARRWLHRSAGDVTDTRLFYASGRLRPTLPELSLERPPVGRITSIWLSLYPLNLLSFLTRGSRRKH
jgi:hypothetical protein